MMTTTKWRAAKSVCRISLAVYTLGVGLLVVLDLAVGIDRPSINLLARAVAMALVFSGLIYLVGRVIEHYTVPAPGHCEWCGYNLFGSRHNINCPECGKTIFEAAR